ncbi:MAG: murein biosynthesis integral membrane protein MurJ [Patescibacteria group bacterium]|nr:murein biosynthesis integral membrane protein MurJ [Patescibacteria group bacterium]MBU1877055.1 murein biosynthesis integral membrane protein MurJ [Patescibacteria group bacterium]
MASLLNFQTRTITQGAIILAFSTFLSRLLGLAREWLLADKFGAGLELDIYLAAFRIPDFIFNIFIVGGVIVSFLPIFSQYYETDKEKAWHFTSNLINVFLLFLIIVSIILFIFAPWILKLTAPGFSLEAQRECVNLTRLMLLSPIFLGLSNIFSGILNYFKKFLVFGLCPILYNLGIILGILFLTPQFGVFGISLGVVLGAFLHFLVQVPSVVNSGFRYWFSLDIKEPGIIQTFKLMLPRILGIASQQINLIFITALASTLNQGSIAIFNFANNLQSLPIGIIGISFATAAFPAFAKLQSKEDKPELFKKFRSIFNKIILLIIPISLFIFIFRGQIVNLILQHGQFSQTSAQLTAAGLGLFCLSLWASTTIPLMLRVFFALKDTKTPAFIAVLTVILNITLSLFFISLLKDSGDIKVLGLVLAFVLSDIFQFCLSFFFLKKKYETV